MEKNRHDVGINQYFTSLNNQLGPREPRDLRSRFVRLRNELIIEDSLSLLLLAKQVKVKFRYVFENSRRGKVLTTVREREHHPRLPSRERGGRGGGSNVFPPRPGDLIYFIAPGLTFGVYFVELQERGCSLKGDPPPFFAPISQPLASLNLMLPSIPPRRRERGREGIVARRKLSRSDG